jgi:predicted DNA-binding ribbon-helix-helix protein
MPPPKAPPRGNSRVRKRTIVLDRHKTSVSVEDAFWDVLKEIADAQGSTVNQLVAAIDSERRERQLPNLSSAIRLFVLDYYRQRP